MKLLLLIAAFFAAANALSLPQQPVRNDKADVDTLELVQIMWRHGDRTPVVQYPKDPLHNESFGILMQKDLAHSL